MFLLLSNDFVVMLGGRPEVSLACVRLFQKMVQRALGREDQFAITRSLSVPPLICGRLR